MAAEGLGCGGGDEGTCDMPRADDE